LEAASVAIPSALGLRGRTLCAALLLLALSSCAPPPRNTIKGEPPASGDHEPGRSASPLPSTDQDEELNLDLPRQADIVEPSAIVEAARRYEGTPYRYGGDSASGMDCSGLVFRVFTDQRISVPRTTEEQYEFGRPVPPDRLRPGDLVFFDDGRGRVQHVGLVVEGDRFLHASTSRRRVVEDSLRQSYFRDRFAGARRVVGR